MRFVVLIVLLAGLIVDAAVVSGKAMSDAEELRNEKHDRDLNTQFLEAIKPS